MRGKQAKRLRKLARKQAAHDPTEYTVRWYERWVMKREKGENIAVKDRRGTVTCTGFRRVYQDLKRQHLKGKAN